MSQAGSNSAAAGGTLPRDPLVLDLEGDTITVSGNDTIDGGAGNDTITDNGSGNNLLRGGEGADTIIYSASATNTVEGGAGNDVIKYATNGPGYTTTVNGGIGDDTLTGSNGSEIYLFSRGDGRDTITDYSPYGASHKDQLVFGTGIAQSVNRHESCRHS